MALNYAEMCQIWFHSVVVPFAFALIIFLSSSSFAAAAALIFVTQKNTQHTDLHIKLFFCFEDEFNDDE